MEQKSKSYMYMYVFSTRACLATINSSIVKISNYIKY